MSPDTAEGKTDRPGLKDLSKLLEQTGQKPGLEQGNTPKAIVDAQNKSANSPEKQSNKKKNYKPYYKNHHKNHPKTPNNA